MTRLGQRRRWRPASLLLVLAVMTGAWLPATGQLSKADLARERPSERPLVFLAEEDSPPFSYLEDGEVKGKIVDLSIAIGQVLGRGTRVELAESDAAQQMILHGQDDGLFVPVSEQRKQLYDFADPIFTIQYGIFVRNDDDRIRDVNDLAGKKVGVMQAGYSRQYFSSHPEVDLVVVKNYEDGFHRLAAGSVDAVATSTWLASYAIQQHQWGNFVLAGPPFALVPESIAVRKNNAELLIELNRAIAAIESNGTVSRIDEKWRPQQMLFVSRERAQRYIFLIVGIFFAVLFLAMAVWVVTLKRHLRIRRKAEEDIRMLISALKVASDCVSISDASDRILYVNEAFLRLYEYEEREIVGKQANVLAASNNDPSLTAEILPASARGGWRGELWNVSKTGRAFLISLATAPIKDEAGKVVGFVGVSRDITEAKRAQETLRASEEKFSLAFKQSANFVLLARMDDRRLVEVNDSFLDFYGATRDEVIGRTPLELGVWVYPDERSRLVALVDSKGRFRNEEVTIQTRSGERRHAILHGDVLSVGSETWLLVTGEDVTAERQARQALNQSELKYRDLFENANDVIFTTTTAGKVMSLNRKAEQLFGILEEQALGLSAPEFFSEAGAAEYRLNAARLQWREPAHMFEVELKNQQGPHLVVLEMTLRLIFESGVATGIQAVGRDISERHQLEAQLRQVQKMEALGSLAGGVAHDFNNLLTVIKGYSVLSRDVVEDNPKLVEALDEISAAADRGAGLTSQLLAFSRQKVSRQTYFQVDEAISGMERMLRRVLGEDVQLVANLGASGAIIRSDPTQFDQVLLNLAVNARDAMPDGGRLEFRSELKVLTKGGTSSLPLKAGEYAMITASDTGCGMNTVTLAKIFEPFFTTKPAGKGTGLGLSTVYGIMQQNGGHIEVASEPGKGTRFTLYFPISKPTLKDRLPVPIAVNQNGSETVLLVDDDASLRQLSANVLNSMGYRVLCASGMEEAERQLYEFGGEIHLLITDVVMPGGGGEVLVEKFGKLRPSAGILFISGYTDGRVPQKYLTGNHPAFLPKPFTPAQLAEKVREMLDTIRG